MKINIQKLMSGGGFYSSSTGNVSNSAVTPTITKQSKDTEILSKLTENLLIDKGLPSDVQSYYDQVTKFETSPFSSGIDKSLLYHLRSLVNQIVQNGKFAEKAIDNARDKDAESSYAIDQRGFIYTKNKLGQIEYKSFEEFDAKNDYAMSVADLIEARVNNKNMAFNNTAVNTIGNSVGLEYINKYILDIVTKIGKASTKLEAYIDVASVVGNQAKAPSDSQKTAIENLYKDLSKNGLESFVKVTNKKSIKNIDEALTYIYNMLPKNMRTTLEGTYIINGGKRGAGINYTADIIRAALNAMNETEVSQELSNPIDLLGEDGSGSSKTHRLSALETLINGDLNKKDIKINTGDGSTITFRNATYMSGIPTFNNHVVSNMPLEMALDAGLGTFLDYSKIFFGDQQVSHYNLNMAIVSNEESATIWAPIDDNGNIDFTRKAAFDAAEEEIANEKVTNDYLKNIIHLRHRSPGKYVNGELSTTDNRVGKFYMTYVTTSDDVIDKTNEYAIKLVGDQKDAFKDFLESMYERDVIKKAGYADPFGWGTKFYRVPVFIAYNDHASFDVATYEGHGSVERATSTAYKQAQLLSQKVQPVNANANLLYIEE